MGDTSLAVDKNEIRKDEDNLLLRTTTDNMPPDHILNFVSSF